MKEDKQYIRKRRIVSGVSLGLFVIILILLTLLFRHIFAPHMGSVEDFLAFLQRFGWKGRLILFGLQCLQIVVALIPGEIIELGAGYAYGALEGALICYAGVALSSSIIFLLVKRFGVRMVEAFISRESIQKLRFINSETKLHRLVFLLYFIPGTPKDALTYFVGLTDMRLSTFLCITLLARIPSVISSTISGQFLGQQSYITAAIILTITALVSIGGYLLYLRFLKKRQEKTK